MRRWAVAGLAICGSLVAGPGCDWGPFDTSPEPAIVTVTAHEFQVGEDYVDGQLAISIESIGPGEVLETSQFISASLSEDATGWTAPIDGTYRLRACVRSAREILFTDGWLGVASGRPGITGLGNGV